MKKFIFAWAIMLAPAVSALGQPSPPADTGKVASPPADTGAVAPLEKAVPPDTGAVAPQEKSPPADTGAVAPPSADTGAVAAPPKQAPVDTGAVALPPKETPVDTAAPLEITPPAETAAVAAPRPEDLTDTAVAPVSRRKLGLGIVFNDEAPVSARLWFNPKVGVDIGVGLAARRVLDQTDSVQPPQKRTTLLDLNFDLGVPVRLFRREKVDFILRPGFGFRTRPDFETNPSSPNVRSLETAVELELNGTAGFEYFPFEKASFSLAAGIALVLERTRGEISNTILRLESLPSKKGVNFAFRYYLL